jgi:hypothetical protein
MLDDVEEDLVALILDTLAPPRYATRHLFTPSFDGSMHASDACLSDASQLAPTPSGLPWPTALLEPPTDARQHTALLGLGYEPWVAQKAPPARERQ